MDDRKAAILRAVIERFIETAQPVGSGQVAHSTGIGVSSATIRNEMLALEREGYLQQPHTSAGRVPTDKGYRFYVDALEPDGKAAPAVSQRVRSFFNRAHLELEEMLHDTSGLLAQLTNYAGVVVGPPHETATVRSAQLVGLSAKAALLVLVLSNGAVEKRTIDLGPADEARIGAASAHLDAHLIGGTLSHLPPTPATGETALDQLVERCVGELRPDRHEEPDQLYVGGASKMVAAFDAVDTVRRVLATLEQQYVVVSLLREILSRGDMVSIGAEHGIEPLAECSVVVAPYEVEGEPAGTIAVLGPTRMDYSHALAAVAVVSRRLGERLSEG